MGSLALLVGLLEVGAGARTYVVDAAGSRVTIEVGRAGLLKLAGHEHTVTAEGLSGEVVADPEKLTQSSVRVVFSAAAVKVVASDGPAEDIPKVQETMSGPKVLDIARFPEIRFVSTAVVGNKAVGDAWDVKVTGDLELHGVKRSLAIPLRITLRDGMLLAEGALRLRQRDYSIEPVSVAGVVKVKDELVVSLRIVARPAP
jgi:polyisoprenoid-binding protein YceI